MSAENEKTEQLYCDACYAYGEGRFKDAIDIFLDLAESGNAMAAVYVAEMYFRGEGITQDVEKGLDWLQRAASWGDSAAAYNLGAIYYSGVYRIKKDFNKSKQYFLLAKKLGCELPVDGYL